MKMHTLVKTSKTKIKKTQGEIIFQQEETSTTDTYINHASQNLTKAKEKPR